MLWQLVLVMAALVVAAALYGAAASAREQRERRVAFAFWVREQRGEVGPCAWLPDRYEKYKREFEAGMYPEW